MCTWNDGNAGAVHKDEVFRADLDAADEYRDIGVNRLHETGAFYRACAAQIDREFQVCDLVDVAETSVCEFPHNAAHLGSCG